MKVPMSCHYRPTALTDVIAGTVQFGNERKYSILVRPPDHWMGCGLYSLF